MVPDTKILTGSAKAGGPLVRADAVAASDGSCAALGKSLDYATAAILYRWVAGALNEIERARTSLAQADFYLASVNPGLSSACLKLREAEAVLADMAGQP